MSLFIGSSFGICKLENRLRLRGNWLIKSLVERAVALFQEECLYIGSHEGRRSLVLRRKSRMEFRCGAH